MDAAGRLVLPKPVRERCGLAGGPHQLEVSDTPDGIVLRPKGDPVPLVAPAGARSGLVYDALILKCAEKSGAGAIYTWNTNRFNRVAWPAVAPLIRAP